MLRLVVLSVSLGALVGTFVFRASSRRKSRTNSKVAIAESSALVPSRPGVLLAGDFRGLFFPLVSLLHGTLFFTLLGETLSMAESASLAFWSAGPDQLWRRAVNTYLETELCETLYLSATRDWLMSSSQS